MDPIRDPEENEITYLSQLGNLRNARVLEIGSGDGRLTWRYANQPTSVVGLDPGPDNLSKAKSNRPISLEHNLSFVQGTAELLPFANESFDVAILSWSL
jgi:malonyl-CoA O-methyltransferase